MADNNENNGPKDITPSPMDEAEKKAKADSAQDAAQAADEAPEQPAEPAEPEPQNLKEFIKYTFLDSMAWNRILQLILLAAGVYGMAISIMGQEFMALPALLGAVALALVFVLDIFIIRKFRKSFQPIEVTARLAVAIIFGLMAVLFAVEIFKPFGLGINKNVIIAGLIAVAAVFAINFLLYVANNKEKILADIYLFIAVAAGLAAILIFHWYYVVISFAFAVLSIMSVIASISNDPLKSGDRLAPRMAAIVISAIMFLAIFTYAAGIFVKKPMAVITYGKITDAKSARPVNLSWSG
ncbi:MAG TPA: hypothetical protein P5511_03780, partial [Candidatus Goldiibacteriota bacterium]|nr:hypothetical protein [Candidatus Goldiibacteriota bacterium]